MIERSFKVLYIDESGKYSSVIYRCIDKSQARRLFYSNNIKAKRLLGVKVV